MLGGLYSAAAGMDAAQARHETAALNLAAAQQPGYRRTHSSQALFHSTLLATRKFADGETSDAAGPPEDVIDFRMGSIEQTGRSLDVALTGDGFFVVEGPRGPLYTRNGRFHVNDAGELVTVDGLKIQGTSGELRLRRNLDRVPADYRRGGAHRRWQLHRPAGNRPLRPAERTSAPGKSLFAAPEGIAPEPSEAIVSQGMLEGSNVSAVSELIELIAASRQYEAASQAMRSITQATQQNIQGRGGN